MFAILRPDDEFTLSNIVRVFHNALRKCTKSAAFLFSLLFLFYPFAIDNSLTIIDTVLRKSVFTRQNVLWYFPECIVLRKERFSLCIPWFCPFSSSFSKPQLEKTSSFTLHYHHLYKYSKSTGFER